MKRLLPTLGSPSVLAKDLALFARRKPVENRHGWMGFRPPGFTASALRSLVVKAWVSVTPKERSQAAVDLRRVELLARSFDFAEMLNPPATKLSLNEATAVPKLSGRAESKPPCR